MTDLDAVKALLAAATPGWEQRDDDAKLWDSDGHVVGKLLYFTSADAALIAAAPTLLAQLVAEVEELRREQDFRLAVSKASDAVLRTQRDEARAEVSSLHQEIGAVEQDRDFWREAATEDRAALAAVKDLADRLAQNENVVAPFKTAMRVAAAEIRQALAASSPDPAPQDSGADNRTSWPCLWESMLDGPVICSHIACRRPALVVADRTDGAGECGHDKKLGHVERNGVRGGYLPGHRHPGEWEPCPVDSGTTACTCLPYRAGGSGPEVDCPVHGVAAPTVDESGETA